MGGDVDTLKSLLGDREWRIENLYRIQDKLGRVVTFHKNESQTEFWEAMWWLNVILKDRQRGFSTLIAIFILDSCLFSSNTQAGIIDITLPDAKKKLDKIRFAYNGLPEQIRDAIPLVTDAKESLEWANGSRVDVSTSHRGGTLQILHVSEFGKIAARKPEVAREIRTGAFNTVAAGCHVFVESTAEGQGGDFYEMCSSAQKLMQEGRQLSKLDFKFHFFGWWMGNENEIDPECCVINPSTSGYLDKVESEIGRTISPAKRAWYQKKLDIQRDDMTREYPSTPKEAFESAIDGAYYSVEMARIRREGRITSVPYDTGYPVDTFWDLGMDDSMTIWFRQRVGMQNRIIDYLEHSGEGLDYYARMLNERRYAYGKHYLPHDANVRELGTGVKRVVKAEELGIRPVEVVPRPRNIDSVMDGIEATRSFLSTCVFDAVKCADGIKCLDGYKKEWDERAGVFMRAPSHNWACHGADAMRTGAVALKMDTDLIAKPPSNIPVSQRDWREVTGLGQSAVAMNLED